MISAGAVHTGIQLRLQDVGAIAKITGVHVVDRRVRLHERHGAVASDGSIGGMLYRLACGAPGIWLARSAPVFIGDWPAPPPKPSRPMICSIIGFARAISN